MIFVSLFQPRLSVALRSFNFREISANFENAQIANSHFRDHLCARSRQHKMEQQEEQQLDAFNSAQDDDLPYQELPMFDYAAHGMPLDLIKQYSYSFISISSYKEGGRYINTLTNI